MLCWPFCSYDQSFDSCSGGQQSCDCSSGVSCLCGRRPEQLEQYWATPVTRQLGLVYVCPQPDVAFAVNHKLTKCQCSRSFDEHHFHEIIGLLDHNKSTATHYRPIQPFFVKLICKHYCLIDVTKCVNVIVSMAHTDKFTHSKLLSV